MSARAIPADPAAKLPAFCEVSGVITPVAGSRIGVVYRLPANWNGKLLGLGGGGNAGSVTLHEAFGSTIDAAEGLGSGYATAQTDAGHASPAVWDSSWAANPEAIVDFAYRAVHLMTGVGKAVTAKYYGRAHKRAYFAGCSTGGRQALMEAQRFPEDYDGVISAAPVYNLMTQSNLLVRWQVLTRQKLTRAQITQLNQAVIERCDAIDGLRDGILNDPAACQYDPTELQCAQGSSGNLCLSPEQVAAVRTAYQGVKISNGTYAAYPLTRGGELGWQRFIADPERIPGAMPVPADGGLSGLRAAMFGDAAYDLSRFDAERDLMKLRASRFADMFEADDPDVTSFVTRGGKLLIWHGMDDPGPSAAATVDYFNELERVMTSRANAVRSSVRLFLAPGVYHCRGGPGPDRLDALDSLDRWVETGAAPERLLARKLDSPLVRPLCPYPALGRYKGKGDPNDPMSFECR